MNKKYFIVAVLCSSLVLAGCSQHAQRETSEAVEEIGQDIEQGVEEVSEEINENVNTNSTVILGEQNDSGQGGSVSLESNEEGKTVVTINATGGTFSSPQPAHIHVGTCDEIGAVQYPLENVVDGTSVTTIDATLEEILNSSDNLAINLHKSQTEASVYTACGNLK
jgi:outer membrane murein-binding lipoprotein Lpp